MLRKKLSVGDEADRASWLIDTSICSDDASQANQLFSPLGAGVMSMTPTPSSVHHRGAWQAFGGEDAASLPASTPSYAPMAVAPAAVRGDPASTINALDPSQRRICLDSYGEKYAEMGGFPIREAIDMYHAVDTGHVNFTKVWMLVDEDSKCRIDRVHFCAFIALVNCIVEQGDRVRLPKTLGEDQVRWLAGEVTCDTEAEEATFHDVPLESSLYSHQSAGGVREACERDMRGKSKNKKGGWSLSRLAKVLGPANKKW